MIPQFKYFAKPYLEVLKLANKALSPKEIYEALIGKMSFSEEDKKGTTPSGKNIIKDRISWTTVYLKKANMITRDETGKYTITQAGEDVLSHDYSVIDNRVLGKHSHAFAEYQYIPKDGVNDKRFNKYKNSHD